MVENEAGIAPRLFSSMSLLFSVPMDRRVIVLHFLTAIGAGKEVISEVCDAHPFSAVLSILGIVANPTTEGLQDSYRAITL